MRFGITSQFFIIIYLCNSIISLLNSIVLLLGSVVFTFKKQ
jgi:hypothetical protein